MSPPTVRSRTRLSPKAGEPLDDAPGPKPDAKKIAVTYMPLNTLQVANRQLRRRNASQIERHAECIKSHAVDLPIFATRDGRIVEGHDTAAAYRHLKRDVVPVIFVEDRSPAAAASLQLWMEAFRASGEWDYPALKDSFELVLAEEPDLIAESFWDMGDIDLILQGRGGVGDPKPKAVPLAEADEDADPPPVTRTGDLFV